MDNTILAVDEFSGLLPLVIGVTGHRDLSDSAIPDIEKAVADVFARLRRDYLKGSDTTPIVVLSPLAEGADQIVAGVALQHGARVIAPLPLPVDEYRRDFEKNSIKSDAAAKFEEWLSRDDIPKVVIPFTPGNSLAEVRARPGKRDEQYRAAGLFIVRHCDVLIALWDGNDEMAVGGTAEIVNFKRRGIPLAVSGAGRASLDAPEIGPVIHIVTPRAKAPAMVDSVSVRPWGEDLKRPDDELLGPDELAATEAGKEQRRKHSEELQYDRKLWTSFRSVIELTDQFNREAEKFCSSNEGRGRVKDSLDGLFAGVDGKTDAAARDKALELAPGWCDSYALADALAQHWHTRFRLDWFSLFALAFAAIVFFELFAHFVPAFGHFVGEKWPPRVDIPLLAGYIFVFIAIFVVFFLARRRKHQERFLDYRALAEALRIAVFWKLNGIRPIADAYPIKLPRELAWVKTCLLARELLDLGDRPNEAPADTRIYSWTRNLWIRGQFSFFSGRSKKHLHAGERRERGSLAILGLAILVAFILLGLKLFAPEYVKRFQHEGWEHDLFLLAVGMLPGLAAVLVGYAEKLAFKAQARQYDRMRQLFERALELLPEAAGEVDGKLARDVLFQLGQEAMSENAEWVAIYRQRPIGLPQG